MHRKDIVSISERPAEAKGRTVPGHREGDLIVGKDRASAIGTLVERTTRLTLIMPLMAKDSLSVIAAFAKAFTRIPQKFKKNLTYDRGTEMSRHKLFANETMIKVYFADPYSPWQRGTNENTNENTNGLIRQYFPKGTDFRKIPVAALKETEQRLNSRPRKALGFYTPSEKFYQLVTGRHIVAISAEPIYHYLLELTDFSSSLAGDFIICPRLPAGRQEYSATCSRLHFYGHKKHRHHRPR